MWKQILKDVIFLLALNGFVLYIRPEHIAPNAILWVSGLITGGYIGIFYAGQYIYRGEINARKKG